jgi:hypothetical protein
MFRTKCATISPTWALSCQRSTTFAAHPLDYVQFRANGSHHRMNPTGPIGPRSIGAFAFAVDLVVK